MASKVGVLRVFTFMEKHPWDWIILVKNAGCLLFILFSSSWNGCLNLEYLGHFVDDICVHHMELSLLLCLGNCEYFCVITGWLFVNSCSRAADLMDYCMLGFSIFGWSMARLMEVWLSFTVSVMLTSGCHWHLFVSLHVVQWYTHSSTCSDALVCSDMVGLSEPQILVGHTVLSLGTHFWW